MERVGKCLPEDLVLGEEAGKARDTCDGDGGDTGRCIKVIGIFFLKPAHVPHVLRVVMEMAVMQRMVHGVDDGAGAEEQAGLEEGVGHQVEHAGAEGADAHGKKHEAKL